MTIYTPQVNSQEDFYAVGDLKNEITWLSKPRYEKALLGLWAEYPKTQDRNAIVRLLRRLTHHTADERFEAVDFLVDVIKIKEFKSQDTLIVSTSDGSDSDGSTAGLYLFKDPLATFDDNWSENNLKPTFEESYEFIENGDFKNIIIFDDFIGSGKTIINKVTEFEEEMRSRNISDINISIFSFVGMKFGIEHIKEKCIHDIYCPVQLLKGISDYDDDNDELKKTVLEMEENLQKKHNNLKL